MFVLYVGLQIAKMIDKTIETIELLPETYAWIS